MTTTRTEWGEVSFKVQPDADGAIHLMLDGLEYTFDCRVSPIMALRLGQALVRLARVAGLPTDTVDT